MRSGAVLVSTTVLLLGACLDSTSGTSGTVGDLGGAETLADGSMGDAGAKDTHSVDVLPDSSSDGTVVPLCCASDTECNSPERRCVEGTCVEKAEPGRCWDAEDCASGQSCLGMGLCSCGAVCEQWYDGPGYCVDPGQSCLALASDHFGLCEAELGFIFDGTGCVTVSGCDCYGFCDYVYTSLAECQAACNPGSGCCATDNDCAPGDICIDTACVQAPAAPDTCWSNGDCDCGWTVCDSIPTSYCADAFVCPCDAPCFAPSTPGSCQPWANGCCTSDAECPGDSICRQVNGGTDCVAPNPSTRCWRDSDCGQGETCYGAFICGCDADCDGADAPGVCITEVSECTAIDPDAVADVCGAASVVVFDGQSCVEGLPGACGCDYFCSLTFQTLAECQQACGDAP